jgi:uncharacterized protein YjbI with pentapeptide repeats
MNPQALLSRYSEGDRQFETTDLTAVTLAHTKLTGINLSQSQLLRADLQGADLALADFSQSNLHAANLSGSNLKRVDFCHADLTEADLSSGDLQEAHLRQSNLERANLNEADLRQCILAGANLSYAKLHSADLSNADLAGADLSGAELRQAKLCCANLRGANLQNANLRWADLSGADLRGADLSGATLSGAILTGTNLRYAILLNATFVHAELTRAVLSEVDWAGADFTGAQMTGVKLHNTRPFGAKFEAVECAWVDLSENGDRSKTFEFKTNNPYEFFYKAAPTLELIIDARMNIEAQSALAVIYQRLSRLISSRLPVPHIIAERSRTQLTFTLRRDEKLFTTAYLMAFPFTDSIISHQAMIELLKSITGDQLQQPNTHQRYAFQRMVTSLNQQRQKVLSNPQLQSLLQSSQEFSFFQVPIRLTLTNSNGQRLLIYSNPNFGRRLTQKMLDIDQAENTIIQPEAAVQRQPTAAELILFIDAFRWSERYLRGFDDN